MPEFVLNISPDTVDILLNIAERIGIPDEIDNVEERLELAIDGIANSIDTQFEVATSDEGTPLQMQEAVDKLLNPNISTTFSQPTTISTTPHDLTWDDILELMPDTMSFPDDPIIKKAVVIVFNQLHQDEWTSEHAERLIDQTIAILKKEEQ